MELQVPIGATCDDLVQDKDRSNLVDGIALSGATHFDKVHGGDVDRAFMMAVLKKFVLAHVALEIPHLRNQGFWKPLVSKHVVPAPHPRAIPRHTHTTPKLDE
jgi:hypothetical protein